MSALLRLYSPRMILKLFLLTRRMQWAAVTTQSAATRVPEQPPGSSPENWKAAIQGYLPAWNGTLVQEDLGKGSLSAKESALF